MTVREFVGMILRRKWIIGGCALAVVLVVTAWSLIATPVYDATATLFVSIRGGDDSSDLQLVQAERSDSYAEIATSRRVLEGAAASKGVDREADELEENVTAMHPQSSVLIYVTARDESPDQAALVANAVALETTKRVEQLERPAGGGVSQIRVSVAQPARVPTEQTSPKVARNIVIGILGGLIFGLVAGIVREMFDRRLRDPGQIREIVDLPVLSAVDFDRKIKGHSLLLTQSDLDEEVISQEKLAEVWQRSQVVEEFRQLRANLEFFEFGERRRSIMVTSASAGEGKTTTAGNLAITAALAGESVVVVDCDLRRPSLAKSLGVKTERGLTDVLIGREELDSVLVKGRRLSMLSSGSVPPNPTELLGSQAMADLLDELHSRYQLVIIDTPPCLPFADATVLTPLCGATLLVVRMGHTNDDQVERAVATLSSARGRLCGVVANMVSTQKSGRYGYYYGYAYGSGSNEDFASSGFGNLVPRGTSEPEARNDRDAADGTSAQE